MDLPPEYFRYSGAQPLGIGDCEWIRVSGSSDRIRVKENAASLLRKIKRE